MASGLFNRITFGAAPAPIHPVQPQEDDNRPSTANPEDEQWADASDVPTPANAIPDPLHSHPPQNSLDVQKTRHEPSGAASHLLNMGSTGSPRTNTHIQRELSLLRQNILSRLESDYSPEGSVADDSDLAERSRKGLADDELQGLRKQRDEADEALRKSQQKQSELEQQAKKASADLATLQTQHSELQDSHSKQKEAHEKELSEARKSAVDAAEVEKHKTNAESLQKQIDELKASHAAETQKLKSDRADADALHDSSLQKMRAALEARVRNLEAESGSAAEKVKAAQAEHESALKSKQEEHDKTVAQLRSEHTAALQAKDAEVQQGQSGKLDALREELGKEHQSKLDALEKDLTAKHRADINARKQSHRTALQDFERRLKETMDYHETAMSEMEAKAAHAESELRAERRKSAGNILEKGAEGSTVAAAATDAGKTAQTKPVNGVSDSAEKELITSKQRHEQEVLDLKKDHENKLQELKNSYESRLSASSSAPVDEKLADAQKRHESALGEQKDRYEELIKQVKVSANSKLDEAFVFYEAQMQKHTKAQNAAADSAAERPATAATDANASQPRKSGLLNRGSTQQEVSNAGESTESPQQKKASTKTFGSLFRRNKNASVSGNATKETDAAKEPEATKAVEAPKEVEEIKEAEATKELEAVKEPEAAKESESQPVAVSNDATKESESRLAAIQEMSEQKLNEQKTHYEGLLAETKKSANSRMDELSAHYEKLIAEHKAEKSFAAAAEPDESKVLEKKLMEAKVTAAKYLEAQHARAETAGAISTERADAEIKESAATGKTAEKTAVDSEKKIAEIREHYEKLLKETKIAANKKLDEAFTWYEQQARQSAPAPPPTTNSTFAKIPLRKSSKRQSSSIQFDNQSADDQKHQAKVQELEAKLKAKDEEHSSAIDTLKRDANKKIDEASAYYDDQIAKIKAESSSSTAPKTEAPETSKDLEDAQKLAETRLQDMQKQRTYYESQISEVKKESNNKLDQAFKHYEAELEKAKASNGEDSEGLKKKLDELQKDHDEKVKSLTAEHEKALSESRRNSISSSSEAPTLKRSGSVRSFLRRVSSRKSLRNGDEGASRPVSKAGAESVAPESSAGIDTVQEETVRSLQAEVVKTKKLANEKLDSAFTYYEERLKEAEEEAAKRIQALEEQYKGTSATAEASA